jgi:predicted nuclease with TOPRIM domain
MDSHSLESASTYLNNLLLARGLLRNGKSIDFARSDTASRGSESSSAKIINLVHDMVLRRDREAEQRENIATNFRILRAEESQRVLDVQRLQSKNDELTRSMSMMEAQERALKASVRRAEAQVRELKEQMLKMKSTLDQVRAKCISDVRKRDVELEKLKAHLTGLQRGKRDASGMKVNTLNPQPAMLGAREMRGGQDVNSADWSIENETNDFLAALVNETSSENVSLRNIVGDAMAELKHVTGLDQEPEPTVHGDVEDGIGIPGQYRKSRQKDQSTQQEVLIPCDKLAREMDAVLEHCRTILKDPSFVSIEEVQIRDDEIIKLRQGWEKMASKWKEAVVMMDTWRRRMLDGGDSVNLDELSHMGLTKSMAVLPNGEAVIGKNEDLSTAMFDDVDEDVPVTGEDAATGIGLFDAGPADEVSSRDTEEESELEIPPGPSSKRLATSPARRGLKLPRPTAALTESSGNAGVLPTASGRSDSFTGSADSGIGSLDGSLETGTDDGVLEHWSKPPSGIPRQVSSRNGVGASHLLTSKQAKKENVPPMTIFEKLAAVEAEAKEAEEARQQEEKPRKRKASKPLMRGKARRRSTLSPEELANLMGVR